MDLQLLSQCGSTYSWQSRSIPEIQLHVARSIPEIQWNVTRSIPEIQWHVARSIPEIQWHVARSIPEIQWHVARSIPEIQWHVARSIPEIQWHVAGMLSSQQRTATSVHMFLFPLLLSCSTTARMYLFLDNKMCCHTEREVADQTYSLI